MSLDHGLLNVPLSKRGNIDRDIDQFKAQQAAERKADAARHARIRADNAAAKRECLGLIAALPNERIAEIAKRLNIQQRSVRKQLRMSAGMSPVALLAALKKEIA